MLNLEQSKKYHQLASLLWRREELQRPARERVDSMGDRGLREVLRYQAEAKAILQRNDWEMPVFALALINR